MWLQQKQSIMRKDYYTDEHIIHMLIFLGRLAMRIIFHIDMNAFYANCEISQHPELKGKPIVISHNSKRSVVSTASYEAREFGVHSAMPLFMAKEKCP